MQSILQSIQSALDQGGKVYMHCKGGIGRTGTVAATWLTEQGLDDKQALALLLQKWQAMEKRFDEPNTPETEAQREFVSTWGRTKASK
jgi:protein-tyrosine phosphatase